MNDLSGYLCEPFVYQEVESVCASLKAGISGVEIDYEHIRFAGPPVWKPVNSFQLYQDFFMNHSFCESLLQTIEIMKGVLPCVKFMRWCSSIGWKNTHLMKVYSLTRSLAFKEGVGCTEASLTILEIINHMSERGSKAFGCFLDVRKAFDTVWIDGLLYKLFSKFGVQGRMWLAIKTLYTGIKAQVLYSGPVFRKIDVSQGTGQGRILAPSCTKFT